jgi:hypothetical protein
MYDATVDPVTWRMAPASAAVKESGWRGIAPDVRVRVVMGAGYTAPAPDLRLVGNSLYHKGLTSISQVHFGIQPRRITTPCRCILMKYGVSIITRR